MRFFMHLLKLSSTAAHRLLQAVRGNHVAPLDTAPPLPCAVRTATARGNASFLGLAARSPASTQTMLDKVANPVRGAVRPTMSPVAPAASAAGRVKRNRLSVIRERDTALPVYCAGRMTISGCMADVCAELERMERRLNAANCAHGSL